MGNWRAGPAQCPHTPNFASRAVCKGTHSLQLPTGSMGAKQAVLSVEMDNVPPRGPIFQFGGSYKTFLEELLATHPEDNL